MSPASRGERGSRGVTSRSGGAARKGSAAGSARSAKGPGTRGSAAPRQGASAKKGAPGRSDPVRKASPAKGARADRGSAPKSRDDAPKARGAVPRAGGGAAKAGRTPAKPRADASRPASTAKGQARGRAKEQSRGGATARPSRSAPLPPGAAGGPARPVSRTRAAAAARALAERAAAFDADAATTGGRAIRDTASDTDAGVRLQKVMASAGVGSRRRCEELIEAGRVSINGRVVREQGVRVDPERDAIHVDGVRVVTDTRRLVLAVNKPIGMVSTMEDDRGRPCIGDLVAGRAERLFHVGRLDAETEGLLLVTNDGELAQRLTHPRHGVAKTYIATIAGRVPRDLGKRLRAGVELEDGPASVDDFAVVSAVPGRTMLELVVHEGRNHYVRRMLAAAGHPVEGLVRTQVGPIHLGQQRPGTVRTLHGAELGALYAAVGL